VTDEIRTIEQIGDHVRKWTLYNEDDFCKVELEELDGYVYVHVTVKQWSKDVLRFIQEGWKVLEFELWLEGYDDIYSYRMNEKFAKLVTGREWEHIGSDNVGGLPIKVLTTPLEEPTWV